MPACLHTGYKTVFSEKMASMDVLPISNLNKYLPVILVSSFFLNLVPCWRCTAAVLSTAPPLWAIGGRQKCRGCTAVHCTTHKRMNQSCDHTISHCCVVT